MIKVGIIGDIVGRIGRRMLITNLAKIKEEYNIDFIVANTENASGGFGISYKNANEILKSGVDVLTGGNHSFDKTDIIPFMDTLPILRPLNFPNEVPGRGIYIKDNIAVINAMGHYGININLDNVFFALENAIQSLQKQGIKNIIVDFHAEASSEKRMAFCMLRGRISALFGTHTHIGSDDLHIQNDSFYVSDLGLCGAYDGVIGMDYEAPLYKAKMGYGKSCYKVLDNGNNIFQMVILSIEDGKCKEAFKLRILNNRRLDDIRAVIL
ncbi:TIGR00282 family metallophosphoesterase [Helicobacter sp. MIT 14-3879]|uniref:TIGR00282 family metallophosphoesterase n=1 Tax=Helicobacter sp. MIT 14-3879 TaxID=2040649 RepID=UPI000E1E40C9|nr:TIGR00282 family metallophosphoesterase [Helicobacter sp. MIT 14-3879]RDU65429.1 metallophosphoesterase [Helicobacter sp. MIT 14-3879]